MLSFDTNLAVHAANCDSASHAQSRGFIESLAAKSGFAFRRIIDVRLARTLLHHGVTEFATANVRDFAKLGFERVWNPLAT